jgi:hypothetical protein
VARIIIIAIPYKEGKTFVAFALSGFIGFFVWLPAVFYQPYTEIYLPVALSSGFICLFGIIGCLIVGVNPLYPSYIRETKQEVVQMNAKEKTVPGIPQDVNESIELLTKKLQMVESPFYFYKNVNVERYGQKENFNFIAINLTGIYHIYYCNWGGEIKFKNSGALKLFKHENDTPDYTISNTYRGQLLRKMADGLALNFIPVKGIICLTNPSAINTGEVTEYDVVHIKHLENYFKVKANGKKMTVKQLFDLKNIIDTSIKH